MNFGEKCSSMKEIVELRNWMKIMKKKKHKKQIV
jgi:hypothetical protein